MELEVDHQNRMVRVWLSNAEKADLDLREILKPVYKSYKEKKYLVAVLESGSGDLQEAMCDLLRHNKTAIAKQQLAAEKAERERLVALGAQDGDQVMSV